MKQRNAFILSLLFFTLLVFVLPPQLVPSELGNTMLTVVAFLFGIIAGFYIVITTTDYNNVKATLAKETASLIALYENTLVYNKDAAQRLVELIDAYVRRNFDREIINYAQTTRKEFSDIEKAVEELPSIPELNSTYQAIQQIRNDLLATRQTLLVLGAKTLSSFQWVILVALAVLFVGTMFAVRNGSLFFDIVIVVISSLVIVLLFLIRDLDLYVWNEQTFGFDAFESVFAAIGKLPYYPLETIENRRSKPTEKEYRVGIPLHGPESSERKIEIRTNA